MSQTQWRAVFRLIFKGASDYEFADRTFMAIAGSRSQRMLTFEDLVFCLHDLVNSFPVQPPPSPGPANGCSGQQLLSPVPPSGDADGSAPSTNTAQFTFQLMQPDEEGRVEEERFLRYTRCIFRLSASSSVGFKSISGDAATFGMVNQGGCGGSDGSGSGSNRGGGIHRGRGSSRSSRKHSSKERVVSVEEGMPPWLVKYAKTQFKYLDSDYDGFITLADLEKVCLPIPYSLANN